MIIDVEVNKNYGGKNYITVPKPVLHRMSDGKTTGIAIKPLGAVNTSFFGMENNNRDTQIKLHFNLQTGNPDIDEKN